MTVKKHTSLDARLNVKDSKEGTLSSPFKHKSLLNLSPALRKYILSALVLNKNLAVTTSPHTSVNNFGQSFHNAENMKISFHVSSVTHIKFLSKYDPIMLDIYTLYLTRTLILPVDGLRMAGLGLTQTNKPIINKELNRFKLDVSPWVHQLDYFFVEVCGPVSVEHVAH